MASKAKKRKKPWDFGWRSERHETANRRIVPVRSSARERVPGILAISRWVV
jgi:hypothetical protein